MVTNIAIATFITVGIVVIVTALMGGIIIPAEALRIAAFAFGGAVVGTLLAVLFDKP